MSMSVDPASSGATKDVAERSRQLALDTATTAAKPTTPDAPKVAAAALFKAPPTLGDQFGLGGWTPPAAQPAAFRGFGLPNPWDVIKDAGEGLIGGVGDVAGTLVDGAGRLTNAGGDFVRNKIAEIAGIDDRVAELDSPGDKFTLGLGAEAAAAFQGGAAVEMEVSRTDDGYVVAVQGEASAGIFGQLGASAGPADAGVQGSADLTGKVRVEAHYDTLEEAQAAAKTIAGTAIGSALGGPVGAAILGGTAIGELRDFADNVTKTTYEVKLSGSAKAELGARVGHNGAGGNANVTASTSAAIVVERGKDPQLVVTSNLSGSASLDLGQDSFDLPGGGALDIGANASAKGTVTLQTAIPLSGISVTQALRDPIGTVRDLAGQIDQGTTTVKANVLLSGDVSFPGTGFSSKDAVELSFSADVNNGDLGAVVSRAIRGDLGEAVNRLADDAQLKVGVHAVETDGFKFDEDISAGIFKIGVNGTYQTVDRTEVFSHDGTARELAADAQELFEDVIGN